LDWIGLGQDFQATLWIGLDWIHELMDWSELGQQKWTHVQLWLGRDLMNWQSGYVAKIDDLHIHNYNSAHAVFSDHKGVKCC